MNLQERVTAFIFTENDRVLSKVTPRFIAQWEGGIVGFATVMERSLSRQAFSGRKSSSVLSRLSLRWLADIQDEISASHAEIKMLSSMIDEYNRCRPHSEMLTYTPLLTTNNTYLRRKKKNKK
jgi:hypothetical protein